MWILVLDFGVSRKLTRKSTTRNLTTQAPGTGTALEFLRFRRDPEINLPETLKSTTRNLGPGIAPASYSAAQWAASARKSGQHGDRQTETVTDRQTQKDR
eukprot:3003016-Rhodomonas_salina.1